MSFKEKDCSKDGQQDTDLETDKKFINKKLQL